MMYKKFPARLFVLMVSLTAIAMVLSACPGRYS